MADFLLKNNKPDLILSSKSIRTVETLNYLMDIDRKSRPIYDDSLYLAEPKKIINCIIKNVNNENTILLVAHNPGIHELSVSLVKNNDELNLENDFPSASMSIFSLGNNEWHDLGNKKLELIKFIRPKDLNS